LSFSVLRAQGPEAQRWTARVNALPAGLRDIHYLPEYGLVYRHSHGFEPLLALYEAGDGFVLQPFVRRPLRELPFLSDAGDTGAPSDIANAYGFGGPLCNLPAGSETARALYVRFAEAFAAWCDDEDIATEFAVLHPFLAEHQLALLRGTLHPRHEKDVVYIDLDQSEAGLAHGVNRGNRSSIAKARRFGVRVEKVEPSRPNLELFGGLYRDTMVRRNAAARWFLPEGFFDVFCRCVGPARSSLFFALTGGEVECACLLMHAFGTAYYHFAGARDARPELRASNLMMLETALWARTAGFTRYHLGGGVSSSAGDTLLRFKAGFSDRRAPLYTYFCVRDASVYERLCERKRAYERATDGRESASDFLPLYRR